MMKKKRTLGLISFRFINAFRNGIFHSFMGIYLRENLQLSVTESNLLFTLLELIGALAQVFIWGWVADKYKARTSLIIGGETIPALGYLGIFYLHKQLLQTGAKHPAGLSIVVGISVLEFFWGAGFIGFFALIADIPNPKDRLRYMGYAASVTSIARICGSMLGGLFFEYKYVGGGFGEGILFYLLSSIILGFAAISWFTRKETEARSEKTEGIPEGSLEDPTFEEIPSLQLRQEEGERTSLRVFYWFITGMILLSMGRGAVDQIALYYLRLPDAISASSVDVSLLVTSYWIGYMISGPIAGQLSGRNTTIGYLIGSTWIAVLPIFYSIVWSMPMASLLFTSKGIAMGTFGVTSFSLVVKVIPEGKRGRLLGQYNSLSMMAWGLGGSLIGGPIADYRLSQGASLASAYLATFSVAVLLGIGAIFLTIWKARPALRP